MNKVWIVIANAESATIYSASEKNLKFDLIKKLSHSESKLKNKDLVSDRPGHYTKGINNGIRGSYAEKTDHKLLEIENFAKEICETLEAGRVNNAYIGLVIVAEPHFYGLLNKFSKAHIKNKIKHHVPKDYTYYPEQKLKTALESDLAHELRLMLIS